MIVLYYNKDSENSFLRVFVGKWLFTVKEIEQYGCLAECKKARGRVFAQINGGFLA